MNLKESETFDSISEESLEDFGDKLACKAVKLEPELKEDCIQLQYSTDNCNLFVLRIKHGLFSTDFEIECGDEAITIVNDIASGNLHVLRLSEYEGDMTFTVKPESIEMFRDDNFKDQEEAMLFFKNVLVTRHNGKQDYCIFLTVVKGGMVYRFNLGKESELQVKLEAFTKIEPIPFGTLEFLSGEKCPLRYNLDGKYILEYHMVHYKGQPAMCIRCTPNTSLFYSRKEGGKQ